MAMPPNNLQNLQIKGNVIPVKGPEVSMRLRIADFKTFGT